MHAKGVSNAKLKYLNMSLLYHLSFFVVYHCLHSPDILTSSLMHQKLCPQFIFFFPKPTYYDDLLCITNYLSS